MRTRRWVLVAAAAGLGGLLLAGCEVKVGSSDDTTEPTTADTADGQPTDGPADYPGPCPVGDWQLTNLDSRYEAGGVSLEFTGASSMKLTLTQDGRYSLTDDGSQPLNVDAEAGNNSAAGTLTVNGSSEGTYIQAGERYVFDEDSSQGSVELATTAVNETFTMGELTGALSPSGEAKVTCTGSTLAIETDIVEMTWSYAGGAPGSGEPSSDQAAPTSEPGGNQPPGGDLTVSTGGAHDCGGRNVMIGSVASPVQLTGNCATVTVTGSANSLRIAQADTVTVSGSGNSIRAAKVGAINVTGTGNSIRWSAALSGSEPAISSSGIGNVVSKG